MSRTKHHLRGRGKRRHLWHGKAKHMFKHARVARDWARADEFRTDTNPDGAALELCALNPRKDGRWTRGERKTIRRRARRSWEDSVDAYTARDDLALEKLMSRRRRNPYQHRGQILRAERKRERALRMTKRHFRKGGRRKQKWVSSADRWGTRLKKTGRMGLRKVTGINPRRGRKDKGRKMAWRSKSKRGRSSKKASTPSAADWRGYEKIKRALRVNPKRGRKVYRPRGRNAWRYNPRGAGHGTCSICSRPHADASSVAHAQDGERPSKKLCFTQHWDDAICNAADRRNSYEREQRTMRNPRRGRRNPKRDGSPTRGENRKVKYLLHLKSIAEKGQNARADIAALTGEVTKADAGIFKPIGKRVLNRVMKAETGEMVAAPERVMEIPRAAEVPANAHPEIANIKSRLADIDSAIEDLRDQVKLLDGEGDDDLNEAAVKQLHEEIAKFAKQKKLLRERMDTLKFEPSSPGATATNPRRRGSRDRRARGCSPRKQARIAAASRRASRSIRILRQAISRAKSYLRS